MFTDYNWCHLRCQEDASMLSSEVPTRRQWTERDELPPEHEEEQPSCASDHSRLLKEAVESPSQEIFTNLCSRITLQEQGGWNR